MNTKSNETSHQLTDEFSTQLPIWKLLAFTVAGFLTIMTETMPAGLFTQISQGLRISEAYAGQLIAVYALGSVLAAIPLISLTRSWNRRPLLLSTGHSYKVETILFIFGISSIVGILITGMFIDRSLRKITLLSLFIFAIATALLGVYSSSSFVVLTGVVLWGITFGGAPTLLQTALANTAGHEADVAQSMLVTVFNLAIAFGGMIGGGLLESFGAASFPWFMLAFALIALCTVYQARKHGFISL
ncbi:MFS transporter [Acinetobacter baumannii]|nr:MFS transporter [Acinetobacter baumannii]EKV0545963.1 MFS transporter [Acinetobacter baumannii]EKX7905555.1 MFS transporter [Acinetobacter baumannii]